MGWKLNIRVAKGSLRLLLDIIIFSFHASFWVRKTENQMNIHSLICVMNFKGKHHANKMLPSQSLTWNLKMAPWNRRFLLETIIFRFHVNLPGCIIYCNFLFEPGIHFWANRGTRSAPHRPVVATADWPRLRNGQKARPSSKLRLWRWLSNPNGLHC